DINHSMRESLLELLSEAKQLRHLNLSNNPISAQIHNDIQMELETNNHLVVLELIDTNITDTVAKAYAQSLSKNTELKGLELSQNNITCDGLKSLSLALRKNYRLEALTLDQNPWQQEYMAFQDETRHMVENICERLKKTFGSKDENALHWIFNVSIFKAIDDFEQWPDIIECPSDKQKELLSQLELALVVRELFRNCHDNLELNQIIDHHKPEEGLMKLMSLLAQRQNIAKQHF